MKRLIWALLAAVVLTGNSGCLTMHEFLHGRQQGCQGCQDGCDQCRGHGHHKNYANHNPHAGPPGAEYLGPQNGSPATGAVSYPYYTTRGPRDFLQNNPGYMGR